MYYKNTMALNINNSPNNNSIQLTPHDYVNKSINEIITEYIGVIKPENKKITTLFIGLGVIIGADIIKTVIQNLIKENQKSINDTIIESIGYFSFQNLFYGYNIIYKNIISGVSNLKNIFKKEVIQEYKNIPFEKTTNIIIDCDEIFIKNLINILENKQNINEKNYDIKNIEYISNTDNDIKILDGKIKKNIIFTDINISYLDINIYLHKLSYDNLKKNILSDTNNITLFDIVSKEYDELKEIYKINIGAYTWTKKPHTKTDFTVSFKGISIFEYKKNISKLLIVDYTLNAIFKNISEDIFCSYVTNVDIYKITIFMINLRTLIELFEMSGLYPFEKSSSILNLEISNGRTVDMIDNVINNNNSIFRKDLAKFRASNKNDKNDSTNKNNSTNKNDSTNKFSFDITNENDLNFSDSINNDKFCGFIQYISQLSKIQNTNNKVKIFTIKLEHKTITNSIDNPEYLTWIENKKQLVEEKKSLEDIIKLIGNEPLKKIITEKNSKEIETNLINNKYASFENLYLRKNQDKVLFDLVETFQNDKKIMEDLGIPNKLGVLLYGEPGCGKTTTILTIASYFGRDIFYINLNTINTNDELKMIFDYVNSKHTGGGVIVIEDIDAMTNIVAKRNTKINDLNTIELMNNQSNSITLEYMLNLLDGTLTFDDSIVIITTNHLEKIDPALYRHGRIDNLIEMKKSDHYQIKKIFKRFIQRDIDENVLKSIPEDKYTPAKIIFSLKMWVKKRHETDNVIMSEFI